ncbi:hypothetical protein OAI97_01025 [Nitrosopumilus sp.]|nr:hypothetical protein [Nitrosopumilus sp.]
MNNEIGRKLTSLTLMTIMLAGGMVIAAPSMVPEAAAAGALYVSAENAMFNNVFGGAMVVEVIVKDPARADTDEAEGEPTVLVDNMRLRLAQGMDGNWYGYFGDNTSIAAVDAVTTDQIDFGAAGTLTAANGGTHTIYGSAVYTTIDSQLDGTTADNSGVIDNPPALSNWNSSGVAAPAVCDACGQIGIASGEWPFIQTFDFTQGDFDIILEQAGADEVVRLDHNNEDLDDYASLTLDRNAATQGADVFMLINDQQLNIDPTDEDVVLFKVATDGTQSTSSVAWTNGTIPGEWTVQSTFAANTAQQLFIPMDRDNHGFGDNGRLAININTTESTQFVLVKDATEDDTVVDTTAGFMYLVFYEDADNTGTFSNVDNKDDSNLDVSTTAIRGTTATFDYNDTTQSFTVTNDFGVIDLDETSVGDEWNSGEALAITLTDQDLNLNTWLDEDLTVGSTASSQYVGSNLIPSMQIGSPLTIVAPPTGIATFEDISNGTIQSFSNVVTLATAGTDVDELANTAINTGISVSDLRTAVSAADYIFVNYDITSVAQNDITAISIEDLDGNTAGFTTYGTPSGDGKRDLVQIQGIVTDAGGFSDDSTVRVNFTTATVSASEVGDRIYLDFFTFGDGTTVADRVNNALYRFELEETDDNTGIFVGEVEYIMLNQLNVDSAATFGGITPTSDDVTIIVHEDLTDEDSPRINYLDLGADGVSTQIADQVAAPSHSGVVSFDSDNYKKADTVVVTLEDKDLSVDSELIDVYIVKSDDKVGNLGSDHLVDITFNDFTWDGLFETGFALVETDLDSGIFVGSFQVPDTYTDSAGATVTVTGTDIEVNYNDHRDASGETIETGAGAAINANTGSVAFDRTVYPVPYGTDTANGLGFKLHSTAGTGDLAAGDVVVHVRVTDADYDVSAAGEDQIADGASWTGTYVSSADHRVVIKVERGSNEVVIATPGNSTTAMKEVSPNSGVFEYDQSITFTDGPSQGCPTAFTAQSLTGCVLQGDIVTVTYKDLTDASGKSQTVTDSATFDLRNGVLQSDKSVYLIGSDMILTLIEPDFDLDNDGAESLTLDLVEWDSDAVETTLGGKQLPASADALAFDPEPSAFRETGDSTGIFQVVIEIPSSLGGNALDRGEKIDLEYTDWGPAGADYVGQEDEDIGLTVYTSNFGATIELDQKVYTWTDKVYITIVAPDHNMDSGFVDEIGNTADDPIKVSTRGNELDNYKLVESGADTGIFIGEVTLAGFAFDADGDSSTGTDGNDITGTPSTLTSTQSISTQTGPTEGKLATTDNDGLTVSFEFSEDETVVGSALIRWNIGEVQWLEASYPASGTGVVRVIDADMNLNPEAIDNFSVDAWSDSDAGGIDLTVTETNEATGIFEGIVFFTTSNDSSGHRLRVAEGDTVTAEYEDNTLPDPYTTADELDITATSLIGTVVPPLERAPAANLRTVDAFGNSLNAVSVDQQVQLTADLANGQDREQSFAYLVQVQDGDGVTVSLAWITGSLSSGQSFSPALSWIPTESGSYTATAFVWESVDNPTALSPPVSTTISVQ